MSAVDHKAEAILALNMAGRDVSANFVVTTGEMKSDIIALAQVHATLYLAEQQRIANLIAVATWNDAALKRGDDLRMSTGQTKVLFAEERARVDAIFSAVREGLGLA